MRPLRAPIAQMLAAWAHTVSSEGLRAIVDQADEQIARAYWTFSRCARSAPPVLVVPRAYSCRRAARYELWRRVTRRSA